MYKTRLEDWGLTKNCTEKRVQSLLHQKAMRDAVGKVRQSNEGKSVGQKIAKYLKRKKKSLEEFCNVEMRTSSPPPRNPPGPDAHPNPVHLSRSLSPQTLAFRSYEDNCPYRPRDKKFRLIEKFSKYVFYPGSIMYT